MVVATYIPSPAIIIGTVRVITTIVVSEAFPFFRFLGTIFKKLFTQQFITQIQKGIQR